MISQHTYTNTIPKIIHYCWFSDPPNYPDDILACLDSWKRFLPDYEIKLWNAKNFDVSICPYVQEAYNSRKFTFASDYVRLWALYHFGGVYLDSDIEVLKSLDPLLENEAFTGFETNEHIAAWIFGSVKGNPLFQELMDYYHDRHFIMNDNTYDMTPNPVPVTRILKEHGLRLDNTLQKLENITVYPVEYFSPKDPATRQLTLTSNTYTIHHFAGSWLPEKTRYRHALELKMKDMHVPDAISHMAANLAANIKFLFTKHKH